MKYYDRMKILSSINKSMKDNDLENDEELDNLSKYKYDRLLIVIPLIPYTIKFSYFVNIKLNFDTLDYCIFRVISPTPKSCTFY